VSAPPDLDALISRAQGGDVRAFEAVLAAHIPQIRRFARAFVDTAQDADDLAQEALIKVYKRLHLFRYQSSFATWLFAVVRNTFLDHAKSRATRVRQREETLKPTHAEIGDESPGPDARLISEEDRAALWEQIRQIPVEFRTALVLFDVEGRTYDEIATIENVSLGTVKSRISRGRERLRRLMGASAENAPGTNVPRRSSHLPRSG
jgi:RNA polymerase sigma-70 factor, ECF subfamily